MAERNSRRKFAAEDFWVIISQADLHGFVEAAVFEDAELSLPDLEEMLDESTNMAGMGGIRARAAARWTKRRIAAYSPRLGLLNNLPMAVPFQTRLMVFRQFVQ